jgi:hypothetical protein
MTLSWARGTILSAFSVLGPDGVVNENGGKISGGLTA